jgi:hypothetical protein
MKAAAVNAAGETPTYLDFAEAEAAQGEVAIAVTASALSPLARARVGLALQLDGSLPVRRRC